jgi:hypothetical protein
MHPSQSWDTTIEHIVQKHLVHSRFSVKKPYSDLILDGFIQRNQHHILFERKLKIVQMRTGLIWQETMGNVKGIQNLGIGHESGLDLLGDADFHNERFCMELKNSYRTDNHSARCSNILKLIKYAREHPGVRPVYGFVNDSTREGNKILRVDPESGIEILYISGRQLLHWVFGDEYEEIIQLVTKHVNTQLNLL